MVVSNRHLALFGLVNLSPSDFFSSESLVSHVDIHIKYSNHIPAVLQGPHFSQSVLSILGTAYVPQDSINFSSLHAFKRGIKENDFSKFLCLYIFITYH